MLDRDQVVRQVSRVLKSGGVFVLLTPNGRYCWYTLLAPLLGCSTRHLSTDRFLDRREAINLLQFAGLRLTGWDFWTFIPKGDYPPLDRRNTGSPGSCGPHLPAGCMSRGPYSYRHQRRLTTLSISHLCAFAMADTGRLLGRERCREEPLSAALVKLESVDDSDLPRGQASTYCTRSVTGRCQARKNPSPTPARSRRLTVQSLYFLYAMPQRLAVRCGVSTSRT